MISTQKNIFNYCLVIGIFIFFLSIYSFAEIFSIAMLGYFDFSLFVRILFLIYSGILVLWFFFKRNDHPLKLFLYDKNEFSITNLLVNLLTNYSLYVFITSILLFVITVIISFTNQINNTVIDRLQSEYSFITNKPLSGLLLIFIIAPFGEEFFFRYILSKYFEKINNSNQFIILGVTIAFVIAHYPILFLNYNDSISINYQITQYLIALLVITIEISFASILFTSLYLKTKKLIYPILAHFIWNGVDVIFLFLSFIFPYFAILIELIILIIIFTYLVIRKQTNIRNDISSVQINFNFFKLTIFMFILLFSMTNLYYYIVF